MKKFFATAICCVAFAGLTGGCETDGSSDMNVAPGAVGCCDAGTCHDDGGCKDAKEAIAPGAVSEGCCGASSCDAEAAVAPGAVSGKSECGASSCGSEAAVAPGAVSGKADCGAGSCDSAAKSCPFSGGDA